MTVSIAATSSPDGPASVGVGCCVSTGVVCVGCCVWVGLRVGCGVCPEGAFVPLHPARTAIAGTMLSMGNSRCFTAKILACCVKRLLRFPRGGEHLAAAGGAGRGGGEARAYAE